MADKEHKDVDEVLEEFAAKIANKEDNPVVAETKPKNRLRHKLEEESPTNLQKLFGRGGFGVGDPDDPMYLKDLQRSRILKKLDLIKDKLGDMKQIIMLLEEQLNKLK